MGSFKLRLVTYFVLLSLVPLLAASWAFSEVRRGVSWQTPTPGLNAALRVAVRDYTQSVREGRDARRRNSLANATSVQRAFLHPTGRRPFASRARSRTRPSTRQSATRSGASRQARRAALVHRVLDQRRRAAGASSSGSRSTTRSFVSFGRTPGSSPKTTSCLRPAGGWSPAHACCSEAERFRVSGRATSSSAAGNTAPFRQRS